MRRIVILLGILLAFCRINAQTSAGALLNETFDDGVPPYLWTLSPSDGYWIHSSIPFVDPSKYGDGSFALFASIELAAGSARSLVTRPLVPTTANHTLSYEVMEILIGGKNVSTGLELYLDVSTNNGATWTQGTTNVLSNYPNHNKVGFTLVPETFTLDLNAYVGQTVLVRFRGVSDAGPFVLGLDNVRGVPVYMYEGAELGITKVLSHTLSTISLRQAVDICPSALIKNNGSNLTSPTSVTFTVTPGTYSKSITVNNLPNNTSQWFSVPAGNGFTATAVNSYQIRATTALADEVPGNNSGYADFNVTQNTLTSWNGGNAYSCGSTTEPVIMGNIMELRKADVINSVTLLFQLRAQGYLLDANFKMSIYSVNPVDSALTEIYTTGTLTRHGIGSNQIKETFPITPQYLPAGLYMFTVNQISASTLMLVADNNPENTLYKVSNGKPVPYSSSPGAYAITLNTGQVLSTVPASNAEEVAKNTALSVRFFDDVTLTVANTQNIQIKDESGNPVAVSGASISGHTLSITHAGLAYNKKYTVTIPTSAINGLWGDVSWSFRTTGDPTTCSEPTELAVSKINPTNATIAWHENHGSTTWELKYGADGFNPETGGTLVQVTANPYPLQGLTEGTTYNVYVRSNCPSSGKSAWSAVLKFKTTRPAITLYGYDISNQNIVSFSSDFPASYKPVRHLESALRNGEYIDGNFYGFTTYQLIRYSKDYQELSQVGYSQQVNDVAYDYSTGTLYGVTNSLLCSINPETGVATKKADLLPGMIAVACSYDGQLYGISNTAGSLGNLYKINKNTGATTFISSTGKLPQYTQSMAFDHQTGRLFWAYGEQGGGTTKLFEIDPVTGELRDMGLTGSGMYTGGQMIGLHTPFEIAALSPDKDAKLVEINAPVSAIFNSMLNVKAGNLNGIAISPSVGVLTPSLSGSTLNIAHPDFKYNTIYRVTIPQGAINGISGNYIWSFRTKPDPDGCYSPTGFKAYNVHYYDVTLDWEEFGRATSWEVKYGATGFNPNLSGTSVIANTNQGFVLTGLKDATSYHIYVRPVCGVDQYGSWSSWIAVSTPKDCRLAVSSFPYVEDFENAANLDCWHQETVMGTGGSWGIANGDYYSLYAHSGTHNYSYSNMSYSPEVVKLVTPKLNISQLVNPILEFWFAQAKSGSRQNSELRVYYKTSENGAWKILTEKTQVVNAWTKVMLTLPEKSADYYIALEGTSTYGPPLIVDDVTVYDFNATDIAVTEITAPNTGKELTATETVRISIVNNGDKPATGVTASFQIDNKPVVTETVTQAIASLDTLKYTFNAKADLSAFGTHTINVTVNIAGDNKPDNNTLSKTIENFNCSNLSDFPWSEGFESATLSPCWAQSNKNSSGRNWTKKTDYVHLGSYSMAFIGADGYDDNWLVTPQFSVPATGAYELAFWSLIRYAGDYTSDNRAKFSVLVSTTGNLNNTSDWTEVWTLTAAMVKETQWGRFAYNLASYAGKSVYIAFRYQGYDASDWYLDDISVGKPVAKDATVTEIAQPLSGSNLTTAETVTAQIYNRGSSGMESFSMTLKVNNTTVATEQVSSYLAPYETMNYTFRAKADLSAIQAHEVAVTVNLTNDEEPSNNTFTKTVDNFDCSITTLPWTEGFEGDMDCWTVVSYNTPEFAPRKDASVANSGSFSWRFSSRSLTGSTDEYNQYLISPRVSLNQPFNLQFYHRRSTIYENTPERFQVGYSTTDRNVNSFIWVDNVENKDANRAWVKYHKVIPASAKYVAIAHRSSNYYLNIDDISLDEASQTDIKLAAIKQPVNGSNLSDAEKVTISITNNGNMPVSNFDANLEVDGNLIATEMVRAILAAGATEDYTFDTTLDLSVFKSYTIRVRLNMPGDVNESDNVMTKIITNKNCIETLPFSYGFETNYPDCWTRIDRDDDGQGWNITLDTQNAHSGKGMGFSFSYYNFYNGTEGFALTPDNWLITPMLDIPVSAAQDVELSWWTSAEEPYYYAEHYDVMVSTTGIDPADFHSIFDETLTTNAWREKKVSLKQFAGQKIYVAFVHNHTIGQSALILDDILVKEIYQKDLAVNSVDLDGEEYGTQKTVKVTLENWGLDNATAATLHWSVDGAAQPDVNWTGTLAYGGKVTVTLASAFQFTVGDHLVTVSIDMTGDENAANNSLSKEVKILICKPVPYHTEFNGSLDEWTPVSFTGGVNWRWANQDHDIVRLVSKTKTNGYALYDLSRNGYGSALHSEVALVSPGLDFSQATAPLGMKFTHWVRNYSTTTAKLQASTDNFKNDIVDLWTWSSAMPDEILQGDQLVDLSSLAGKPVVRLRFLHIGNDAYGWAIDDINISSIDASSDLAILSGEPAHTLNVQGDNVVLNAVVINYGVDTKTNVPVTFTVNGQAIVKTIPSLAYGQQQQVSATWANAPAGAYEVVVSIPDDANPDNNTVKYNKYVAYPNQLRTGFEPDEDMSEWTMTTADWRWQTNDTRFSYQGNGSAVAGAQAIAYTDAKLITPLVALNENDWIAFYAEYLNIPAGTAPTIQIMYSQEGDSWTAAGSPVSLQNHYVDYKVDLGLSGNYFLAFNATGPLSTAGNNACFAVIDHVIISDTGNVGIATVKPADGLTATISPVPVRNYADVTVNGANSGKIEVTVYSVTGQVYHTQTFTDTAFRLDLSKCPAGVLFVKISAGKEQMVKKITKK